MFFVLCSRCNAMVADFSGMQAGDFSPRDIAQTITNINAQLGDVLTLLQKDIEAHDRRISALETWQSMYTDEKQALTGLLIGARNEARTVSDVHDLLKSQIANERSERDHRRRHLDNILNAVFIVAAFNLGLDLFRVFRRSRTA